MSSAKWTYQPNPSITYQPDEESTGSFSVVYYITLEPGRTVQSTTRGVSTLNNPAFSMILDDISQFSTQISNTWLQHEGKLVDLHGQDLERNLIQDISQHVSESDHPLNALSSKNGRKALKGQPIGTGHHRINEDDPRIWEHHSTGRDHLIRRIDTSSINLSKSQDGNIAGFHFYKSSNIWPLHWTIRICTLPGYRLQDFNLHLQFCHARMFGLFQRSL